MNKSQWQFGEGNEYLSLDFARCQRADGSYYGTGGQCRKGTPVGPKEVKAIAKKAAEGDERAKQALEKMAGQGDPDAKKALEAMGGDQKAAPEEKKPEEKKPESQPPAKKDPDEEAQEVLKSLTSDQEDELMSKVTEDMDEMDGVLQDVGSKLRREEDIVDDEVGTIEAWREERLGEYTKGVDPIEGPITSSMQLEDEIMMRQDSIKSGNKDELDEIGGKAKVESELKILEKAREFTNEESQLAGEFDRYVQNRNGLGYDDERNRSWALSGLHPTVQPDDDFNDMAISLGKKAYANIPGKSAPSDEQALAMGLQLFNDNYGGFDVKEFRNADRQMMDDWMGINPYYTKWDGPGPGPI